MNREEYIQFRKDNDYIKILYEFVKEKGFINVPYIQFTTYIMQWGQYLSEQGTPVGLIDFYTDKVVEHYDIVFKVVLVIDLKDSILIKIQ